MFFTKESLWESQISTQTTAMSNLGDALIIYGFNTNVTFLNKYTSLSTPLTISGVMTLFSIIYGSLSIFKYDLDLERWELSIESKLILLIFFKYFSIMVKSEELAGLFIVIVTFSFVTQIKSVITFDLIFFRHLLTWVICWWAKLTINSAFNFAIEIIICFLDGLLVVILTLGFFFPLLQFFALIIFLTLLANKARNASLKD